MTFKTLKHFCQIHTCWPKLMKALSILLLYCTTINHANNASANNESTALKA